MKSLTKCYQKTSFASGMLMCAENKIPVCTSDIGQRFPRVNVGQLPKGGLVKWSIYKIRSIFRITMYIITMIMKIKIHVEVFVEIRL